MAYKEEHFDKAGAKAIYKALTQDNNNVTKGKKSATSRKPAKKASKKR